MLVVNLFVELLYCARELLDLHLHLCVLITSHLIDDLLLFGLKLFNLLVIVFHHCSLLKLHLLDVLLECNHLGLKLVLEWLKVYLLGNLWGRRIIVVIILRVVLLLVVVHVLIIILVMLHILLLVHVSRMIVIIVCLLIVILSVINPASLFLES